MTKYPTSTSVIRFYIGVFLLLNFNSSLIAQITVEFPYSRLVFQQDTAGNGEVLVSGYTATQAKIIQARLVPFANTTGTATEWQTCPTIVFENRYFFTSTLKAAAGWYNLEVRSVNDSVIVVEDIVQRIGIGEVFIIAGQSNAQGQTLKEARSSKDPYERVGAFSGYDEKMDSPSFKAEQLNNYISIFPVGVTSWCWAELGDKIAERRNVPVFFLNTAWGGTGSTDWVNSVDSSATFENGRGYVPYGYLQRTIQFYRNILGFRAVLWHQGESDTYRNNFRTAATKPVDYYGNMQHIITPSRKQVGGDLAWVISQTTFIYDITDSLVLEAQRKLARETPNVFSGPYTDTLTNARYDGVHFTNEFNKQGLTKLANAWDQALDSTFFKLALPTLPNFKRSVFITDSTNQLLIPPGFTVRQVAGQTTSSFRFLTDESGNYYVSALQPCGKKLRQFREMPKRASFNNLTGDRPVNKLVILTNRAADYNPSSHHAHLNVLSEGTNSTTFTIEVDGCR